MLTLSSRSAALVHLAAVDAGGSKLLANVTSHGGRQGGYEEDDLRSKLREMVEEPIVETLVDRMRVRTVKTIPLGLVKDPSNVVKFVSVGAEAVIVAPSSSPVASALAGQKFTVLLSSKLRDRLIVALR
ncbi:hypothetical protein GCM10007116_07240 [Sulfodiicoccus acidiphilus]|nr:hypothetical protein GCM10007116_07240 [Sulfodiicoccus acidiphilus]